MTRCLVPLVLLGLVATVSLPLATGRARAQMDSREGIALQNQILELRRDLQYLRDQAPHGGGALVSRTFPPAQGPSSGGYGTGCCAGWEIVPGIL